MFFHITNIGHTKFKTSFSKSLKTIFFTLSSVCYKKPFFILKFAKLVRGLAGILRKSGFLSDSKLRTSDDTDIQPKLEISSGCESVSSFCKTPKILLNVKFLQPSLPDSKNQVPLKQFFFRKKNRFFVKKSFRWNL